MAKIIVQITDETVKNNVEDTIKECTEEGWIDIPQDEMAEFVQECVDEIVEACEFHERDRQHYDIDYEDIVLDLAHTYGWCLDPLN